MSTTESVTAAIDRDERRERRDSYRRYGGSHRRPLKSFMTTTEKRERREEHAERVRDALANVATEEGFGQWLEARELNPRLTPLSAALVALQAPGYIVGTLRQWKASGYRVAKGEVGGVFLTAPGFWPVPAFAACQTDAPPELTDPDAADLPSLAAQRLMLATLRERFETEGQRTPTLNAYAESLAAETQAAERAVADAPAPSLEARPSIFSPLTPEPALPF